MCEVTLSITGEVCGRWSITYPNLQHSEAVKLTKAHCQALHRLDKTTLDEIPLHQETSSGAFTSLTITPKCIGVNIIKIRFGSTHSDGPALDNASHTMPSSTTGKKPRPPSTCPPTGHSSPRHKTLSPSATSTTTNVPSLGE